MDDGSQNHGVGGSSEEGGSSEQIDIESYASLYTGHTKILRLQFIADHCNSRAVELEALRMAFDEIKRGENSNLYRECAEKIGGRLGPSYTEDQNWIDTADRRAAIKQDKLEIELNGYKVKSLLPCLHFSPSRSDVS